MIKKILIIFVCVISAFILIYASQIESCFYQTDRRVEENKWIGKSTNTSCEETNGDALAWSCDINWSNGEKPQSNDIVVFDSSSLENSHIDITFQIYGMRVEESYSGIISKIEDETLKIGSGGLTMKNGTLKLGETFISPKQGELNLTFANYHQSTVVQDLIIERVAFSCSEEVLQNLSNDVISTTQAPLAFVTDIFQSGKDAFNEAREEGVAPIFNIINVIFLFSNLLFLYASFKIRRSFGYIRDRISKEPIKFTPFKVLLGASTNISYRGLTDIEGRYCFPVIPGSYRVEIVKEGYLPFNRKINVNSVNIFTNYIEDIDLEPNGIQKYQVNNSFNFTWKYKLLPKIIAYYPAILLLSIINLIYILIGETNTLYVALSTSMFIIYVFIYLFNLIKPRPQLFEIIDSENGLRIPNVLVKIIDHKSNKLIDTKITNHDGFFESAIHKGEFSIFISHPGYSFPSKFITDNLKKTSLAGRELLIVNFKTNGSKKSIYLDPLKPSGFTT